ncbi:MAG: M3 family metallopeptidase [Rhodocyclaceae bacterium]
MTNPLLDPIGLPRFDAIRPEHVVPAISQLIAENRALVERLALEAPASWEGFAAPFFDAGERLGHAWGIAGHLHAVLDVPAWREAYNAALPEVTRFYSELGQDLRLFAKFKAIAESPDFAQLAPVRRRIVEHEVRDFRLGGAELPEEHKPRLRAIHEELAHLAARFQENLLDATNAFVIYMERTEEVAGIPEDVLAAAQAAARQEGRGGWKFTLHAPSYVPVMQYADHRPLREALYRAHATRASEFGKPEWDNGPLIDAMLGLRAEEARLLGYADYAQLSLVPKMAESPEQIAEFLRELAGRARPFAERDVEELREFARAELALERLEAWDLAWASEKLRQRRYAFSEQEVKQYFPEDAVLSGLFALVEGLYGVRILPDTAPAWHPDVGFRRIERDGRPVGQFYLDLHARDTKRGGAWMDEAMGRRRTASGIQTPVAYLNCNFSSPVAGRPALLTHDEVLTLFHEAGHALHHLLTEVEELPASGIHGVEWDAVELPSQFMENFCWEWDVLRRMTRHVASGASLPRSLFERMAAAKNFQSGMQMLRQIEFSLFDLRLHHGFDPDAGRSVLDLLEEVRDEVAVIRPPEWNRFPNSFSHIFGGGYAAGYYSYKWAEVLSADAYEAFEEAARAGAPVPDPVTGSRFLREVLATGGSRPAMESFIAFRGRAPRIDALLRHDGMIAA